MWLITCSVWWALHDAHGRIHTYTRAVTFIFKGLPFPNLHYGKKGNPLCWGMWVSLRVCVCMFDSVYSISSVTACVNGSVLMLLQGHRLMRDESSGWRHQEGLAAWWFTLHSEKKCACVYSWACSYLSLALSPSRYTKAVCIHPYACVYMWKHNEGVYIMSSPVCVCVCVSVYAQMCMYACPMGRQLCEEESVCV